MTKRFFPLLIAAYVVFAAPAMAFDTRAKAAYVVDLATGTVLMAKNAEEPLPPASMSKLMTLNMLFEALHDGRVQMDTTFSVSAKAKAITGEGGSTMFLNEQDKPTVEELIQGIVVNSGNDAAIVIAEGLAGSEEAFAQKATDRARALGMTGTTLVNASGWPDPGQRMSVHDLAIVAQRMVEEFPEYYHYFAETEFNYKDRAADNRFNRNPLLSMNIGADGLKTGHTREAGYGLVGSAKQGDRRIVFVLTGMESDSIRAEEAERITNWAFRQFVLKTVAPKGVRIAEADVWMGDAATVGLVVAEDTKMLLPAELAHQIPAEVIYSGPIKGGFEAGAPLAELVLRLPDMGEHRIPLVAETAVGKAGIVTRLLTAAWVLYGDVMGSDADTAAEPAT
jgi:serine-type D-Ala-D-Ala carboxypeptidase (penicillin-binding protein 5/6)